RPTLGAQIGLHQTGGTGKDKIRRGSGNNDEIELGGISAGIVKRRLRSLGSQLAGGGARIGNMALAYAGALHNPGIRGFDVASGKLGGKLVVADNPGWQVTARPYYLGIRHSSFQIPVYEAGSDKSLESFADCAAAACKLWRRWSMALVVPSSKPFCTASRARCRAKPKAYASAEPWLLTTIPRKPSKVAPL